MEVTPQFMERRAVAHATVLLTRYSGLIVAEARGDSAYDLEVAIPYQGQISGRVFGVELKARVTLDRVGRFTREGTFRLQPPLRDALRSHGMRVRELPFPVLYMVFAMETDRTFFGWLREPLVTPRPRLVSMPVEFAVEWQASSHKEVVGQVQRWYDVR
jgi:hypothetical protein